MAMVSPVRDGDKTAATGLLNGVRCTPTRVAAVAAAADSLDAGRPDDDGDGGNCREKNGFGARRHHHTRAERFDNIVYAARPARTLRCPGVCVCVPFRTDDRRRHRRRGRRVPTRRVGPRGGHARFANVRRCSAGKSDTAQIKQKQ